MKWFQHEADDRNKLESKLIRSKFGAEGYGIFQSLKEIVSEYVEQDNVKDWGKVHPLHTIETLAEECSVTSTKLREFLAFCNEKEIFEKSDNRLFYPDIMKRLDNFATRIRRDKKPTTKSIRSKNVAGATYNTIHNNTIQHNTKEEKYPLSYLSDIPENDLEEFTKKFKCNSSMVKSKANDIVDWIKATGKKKKDYKATLRTWLRKDFGERPAVSANFNPEEVAPEISEEVRMKNLERSKQIKDQFKFKN